MQRIFQSNAFLCNFHTHFTWQLSYTSTRRTWQREWVGIFHYDYNLFTSFSSSHFFPTCLLKSATACIMVWFSKLIIFVIISSVTPLRTAPGRLYILINNNSSYSINLISNGCMIIALSWVDTLTARAHIIHTIIVGWLLGFRNSWVNVSGRLCHA